MKDQNPFAPGGPFYGQNGLGDYEFVSWREVFVAVGTVGHTLAQWDSWILSRRPGIKSGPLKRIRVSLDANPPIVEVVYPRWAGWGGALVLSAIFWAGLIMV